MVEGMRLGCRVMFKVVKNRTQHAFGLGVVEKRSKARAEK